MRKSGRSSKASTPPKKAVQQEQVRPAYANTISPPTENAGKHSSSRPNVLSDDRIQVLCHALDEANQAMFEISQRLGTDFIVLKLRGVVTRLSAAVSAISIDDLEDAYPDQVKELHQTAGLQCSVMNALADRLSHEVAAKDVDTCTFAVPGITKETAQPCIAVSASSSPRKSESSPRTTASASPTNTVFSAVSVGEKTFESVDSRPIIGGGDGCTTKHMFRCGGMLGKGGFAKVFICTNVDSGKQYAVKILSKTKPAKGREREKERLQNEINIHSQLAHKHVCKYKHSFEDRSSHYLLLELCPNETVRQMIEQRGRLTEPETKYFILQLLEAVKYLHQQQKIVHRDLKPFNLFLDKNLNLKVGDFGLAVRCPDEQVKTKMSVGGSPTYMSPEVVCVKKKLSCRFSPSFEVDLWSIGAICFSLLVGQSPFKTNSRNNVDEIFQRILDNQYEFPSHLPMSANARDLISALLQTDPQDRLTLDKIQAHPFLTHDKAKIPATIPLSATHVPPDWREDDQGMIYAVTKASDEQYRRPNIVTTDVDGPEDEFPSSPVTSGVAAAIASEAVRAVQAVLDSVGNIKSGGSSPGRKQQSSKENAEDNVDTKKCSTLPIKKSGDGNRATTKKKAKNERFANTAATSTRSQTCTNTRVKEETNDPLPKAGDDAHPTAAGTTHAIASASDPPPPPSIFSTASTVPAKGKKQSKRNRKKGKKRGEKSQRTERKKQAPPQDAPAPGPIDTRMGGEKNEDEPTASNPNAIEDERADDEKVMAITRTLKDLSSGDKARAEFWKKEREHREMYTNALTGWAAAECARRQTQAKRRSEEASAFERAFIDPEEVKENETLMKALAEECETAYKTLYGHRTGGTIKIVDSSDDSVIGRFGKIVGQGEPSETFKIELLPTKAEKIANRVKFAVVSPMGIELAQGDTSKTSKKRAKKGGGNSKKKKTKKTAGKSGPPTEYTFTILPSCDYDADDPTVTTSHLDNLAADPADLANTLDRMMADRSVREEERMQEEKREALKHQKDRMKERDKSEELGMDAYIKRMKKTARILRSYEGLDRVPLSERLGFDAFVEEVVCISRVESVDRDHFIRELRIFLDGITDIYDVFNRGGATDRSKSSVLESAFETLSCFIAVKRKSPAHKIGAAQFVLTLFSESSRILVDEKVFVMFFGIAPIYSYEKDADPFKKGRYKEAFDAEADEEKLEECADLLGVPPHASEREVTKAFRKKALEFHPDKWSADSAHGMSREDAEEQFKSIQSAAEYMLKRFGCDANE